MHTPPRILFVTPVSPFAMASGAEQRSGLMYQALCQLGPVDVVEISAGAADSVTTVQELGHTKVKLVVGGANLTLGRYQPKPRLNLALQDALGQALTQYRCVVARYLWPGCQLDIPASVPILVDLDDFKYRYGQDAAWSVATLKERMSKWLAHRLARRQLRRFTAAFAVSAADQAEVTELPSVFLPNVPLAQLAQPTPVPSSQKLLFVGSLWYRPNSEGVDWFLAKVWPQVLAANPGATLTLVGAAPAATRAAWAMHPRVAAPGFVDSLDDVYKQANLVIVPVHSGGGTNIKVLEALAHGRPCLVTQFVHTAFATAFVADQHLLVAAGPAAFAAAANQALASTAAMGALARQGHAKVAQLFTPQSFQDTVVQWVATQSQTPSQ